MARNSKYMPYVFYDMPNSKYKILLVVIFCSFQNVFYEVNKFPFVETNTKIRQDFYSCHGCNFTILL